MTRGASARVPGRRAPLRGSRSKFCCVAQILPADGTARGRLTLRSAVGVLYAVALLIACSPVTGPRTAPPGRVTPFLEDVQSRTFQYFWQLTNPLNGLTPDRAPSPSFSSVAAVGFALTAYPIGVERGYISRSAATERVLTTLKFFWTAPQGAAPTGVTGYKGFFYHFLDMQNGRRFQTVELSTIDTALLLAGVILCQEYFDGTEPNEAAIRAYADSLYLRVDWQWAQNSPPTITLGWKPEEGFIPYDWRGYNEAMLVYVLALGSPTYPIGEQAWNAWVSGYKWGEFHGQRHVGFAPLFGHQYSHVWIDFRGIQDAYMRGRGIDYFENTRRATLAQRSYAIANPMGWRGYGADVWGLTASDGPLDTTVVVGGQSRRFYTYAARGASFTEVRDDGTIAPTAAGGSIPFAPDITIPALEAMYRAYGANLFSTYGFLDAFNPTFDFDSRVQHGRIVRGQGWFDTDYLGIDQGPIVAMIENYRNAFVWEQMKKSPHIRRGLQRAGFTGGWLARISQRENTGESRTAERAPSAARALSSESASRGQPHVRRERARASQ